MTRALGISTIKAGRCRSRVRVAPRRTCSSVPSTSTLIRAGFNSKLSRGMLDTFTLSIAARRWLKAKKKSLERKFSGALDSRDALVSCQV